MIKACVFDLGNTLTNDTRLSSNALQDLASWLKTKRLLTDEETFVNAYKEFNMKIHHPHWSHTYGEVEWFKKTLNTLGIKGIGAEELLVRYRHLIDEKTELDHNVVEVFKFLQKRGIKIALLSNERTARTKMFLKKTKIKSLLDAVVVSEEIGVEKPHPGIFEEARRKLGVEFSQMVMFGDSETADGGSKKLGMKFVLVEAYRDPAWNWGNGQPVEADYILENITKEEMERCLKTLERDDGK